MSTMKNIVKSLLAVCSAALALSSCKEQYTTYGGEEYVMFADTVMTYAVQKDVDYFSIPVVSTVAADHDRTFGVEILDSKSNAIENYHYSLRSNTVTIPAGQTRADVQVHGLYDNIQPGDSLAFTLSLVMPDELEMGLYGRQTRAELMKVCPFDVEAFTGWCVVSSTFLQNYSITGEYQRLVRTSVHPLLENTVICHDWLQDGYDVNLSFDLSDPLDPQVILPEGQTMSDEASFFGMVHGDNRILVRNSALAGSYYSSCGTYLYVWTEMYVKNLDETVGTVGHFYNVMQWVSDEEAERLRMEEGM